MHTRYFLLRLFIALVLLLSINACTLMPKIAPTLVERHYHDSIVLRGRLTVSYQQNGAPKALHGSFIWHQEPQYTAVSLLSPLGQTLAVIEMKPELANLIEPGKPPRYAADANTLIEQALGWPLPVSDLHEWLQGFGHDIHDKPFIAEPTTAPLRLMTHDGWNLTYQQWDRGANQESRPKRIDLTRETEQAGIVSIRIMIDRWETP